jgi:N-carbamoyl-L-amino-acid hydrolase
MVIIRRGLFLPGQLITKGEIEMQDLNINSSRLWDTITETARFGITDNGGICRQTLTYADRQVRDWFVNACEDIGCTVTVDDMGNTFACR